MSHHWGHFLAAAAALLAIALILAVVISGHQSTTASVYRQYIESHWAPEGTEGFATESQRADLAAAAHEGVRWGDSLRFEMTVWVVVLLVVIFVLVGYHVWQSRSAGDRRVR